MRSAPLNYLVALAIAGILWIVTGFWLARYLGDAASLQMTTEQFEGIVYVAFAILAAAAVLDVWYWFYHGSRSSTLSNMNGARRVWTSSFVLQIVLMILMLVTLVVLFRAETISTANYLLILAAAAIQAPLFFWLTTAMMSPNGVKYIPWGVR